MNKYGVGNLLCDLANLLNNPASDLALINALLTTIDAVLAGL